MCCYESIPGETRPYDLPATRSAVSGVGGKIENYCLASTIKGTVIMQFNAIQTCSKTYSHYTKMYDLCIILFVIGHVSLLLSIG